MIMKLILYYFDSDHDHDIDQLAMVKSSIYVCIVYTNNYNPALEACTGDLEQWVQGQR